MRQIIKLFFIAVVLFTVGCASSGNTYKSLPAENFDKTTYVDPQKFGYKPGVPDYQQPDTADQSFEEISIKGGPRRLYSALEYPASARRNLIQGKVVFKIYVDTTGKLTNLELTQTANSSLVKSAKKALSSVSYNPATLNGKPVNSFTWIPLIFQAKRKSEINW